MTGNKSSNIYFFQFLKNKLQCSMCYMFLFFSNVNISIETIWRILVTKLVYYPLTPPINIGTATGLLASPDNWPFQYNLSLTFLLLSKDWEEKGDTLVTTRRKGNSLHFFNCPPYTFQF